MRASRSRALKQNFVKAIFGFEDGGGIAIFVGLRGGLQGLVKVFFCAGAGIFSEETGGQSFEHRANGIQIFGFSQRQFTNYRAFVGNDGDESFGFQSGEGLRESRCGRRPSWR